MAVGTSIDEVAAREVESSPVSMRGSSRCPTRRAARTSNTTTNSSPSAGSVGKPGSQFGASRATPDWRGAAGYAENMFERTRDLRVAIYWLRARLNLVGFPSLPAGLRLVIGLVEH